MLTTSVKLWDHAAGKESPDGTPTDNMQVGYIVDAGMDPATAGLLLEALKKKDALKDAVLTAVTQPYRLPGSLNLKHDPPFAARLILWDPQTRYLPSEIASAYALGPKPKTVPRRRAAPRFHHDSDDPVWRALQAGRYVLSDKAAQRLVSDPVPVGGRPSRALDGRKAGQRRRLQAETGGFKCFHSLLRRGPRTGTRRRVEAPRRRTPG